MNSPLPAQDLRPIRGARPGEFGIHFGALCDPLEKQIRAQLPKGTRLTKEARDRLSTCQKLAESITWLAIHNLLPDAQKRKLQLKLLGRITDIVRKALQSQPHQISEKE